MVNRIQKILEHFDLTPSRFADNLEVPRSTISHILSERNKPSLEFIQKVFDKYPELSVRWLVKGEGPMLEDKKHDKSLPFTENLKTKKPTSFQNELFPSEIVTEHTPVKEENIYSNPEQETTKEKGILSSDKENIEKESVKKNSTKKIAKIITIYHDNTFDEYFPSIGQ